MAYYTFLPWLRRGAIGLAQAAPEKERLTVPHPRMQERSFVLLPLQELNPEYVVPEWNKTVNELVAELPANDLKEIWKYAPES